MTTLSIVGTTVCNAAFDTGYIFSKELFPTILRTSALSTASAFARIGSLLTPLVATLEYYDPMLPVACYGIFVLIAGIQVCTLVQSVKSILQQYFRFIECLQLK